MKLRFAGVVGLGIGLVMGLGGCFDDEETGGASGGAAAATAPGSATPGATAGGGVAALPTTAFVYEKVAADGAFHVFAYDTATSKETEISALEDDGKSGVELRGVALSPDRTRIAFVGDFRLTKADLETPGDGYSVWTMSVAGDDFQRIVPTLPPPSTPACTSSVTCLDGYVCNQLSGHCLPPAYEISRSSPSFSPDGSTVWFDDDDSFLNGGLIAAGGTIIGVDVANATVQSFAGEILSCSFTSDAAVSPDGTRLAVSQLCGTDQRIALIDLASRRVTPLTHATGKSEVGPIRWTADGKELFHLEEGKPGASLVADAVDGSGSETLATSPDAAHAIQSFTLSRDGAALVFALGASYAKSDLYLVTGDASGTAKAVQLTTDGVNADPEW